MCSWLNLSVKVAADIVLSQTLDTTCAGTAGVQYTLLLQLLLGMDTTTVLSLIGHLSWKFGIVGYTNLISVWPVGLCLLPNQWENFNLNGFTRCILSAMNNAAILMLSKYWASPIFRHPFTIFIMAKGINGQTPSVESLQPKLQSNSEPQGFIGWYQLTDITSVTSRSSSCKASSCETKEMMLQGDSTDRRIYWYVVW